MLISLMIRLMITAAVLTARLLYWSLKAMVMLTVALTAAISTASHGIEARSGLTTGAHARRRRSTWYRYAVIIERNLIGGGKGTLDDRLVLSSQSVGVVDGATAKDWDSPRAPNGAQIAECVADVLLAVGGVESVSEVVQQASDAVLSLHSRAGVAPGSGSAATFAVVAIKQRQVWRVGDAHVMINGAQAKELPTGELIVARARALVIRQCIAMGMTVDQLRRHDLGREAIQPILQALTGLRNIAVDGGYGAIDGRPVPDCFVESIVLPDSPCEVSVGTDGYPRIAQDLETTEQFLQGRLAEDPLMIAEPPATKGWMVGAVSFDDRSFVRIALPAKG